MTPDQKLNIFISYGRKDSREIAIQLRDHLSAYGFEVWLDLAEIAGGDSWSLAIEEAIDVCDVALLLMSQASYESQWCRAEQLRCLRKGKHVIPIQVQGNVELPIHLEHLNFLDLSVMEAYETVFEDLVTDIRAGQAFRVQEEEQEDPEEEQEEEQTRKDPFKTHQFHRFAPKKEEKRRADGFRQHISNLREESWLGNRYWWTYFAFHVSHLDAVVEALKEEELVCSFNRGKGYHSHVDKMVRFDFRPRKPSFYDREGFRPVELQTEGYVAFPIYLLFDLESIVCHEESRFCDGPIEDGYGTFKTLNAFRDLPFDVIYHDQAFTQDERDEILRYREAQILIPNRISLEGLQLIWLRSDAEYESLKKRLPAEVWQHWRDKITIRADHHVFNRRWAYVNQVRWGRGEMVIDFHPPLEAGIKYDVRVEIETIDGQLNYIEEKMNLDRAWRIQFSSRKKVKTGRIWIDKVLAYAGDYQDEGGVY